MCVQHQNIHLLSGMQRTPVDCISINYQSSARDSLMIHYIGSHALSWSGWWLVWAAMVWVVVVVVGLGNHALSWSGW